MTMLHFSSWRGVAGKRGGCVIEIKCLELRDRNTFIPVICIRPVPENDLQRYLLRRDGYRGDATERCIIMVDAQCRGVAYDCYGWPSDMRTKGNAHKWITEHWHELVDGDVVDVEYILGETKEPKISERFFEESMLPSRQGKAG